MQAKHTSFKSFTTALVKAAINLDNLSAEAGPWLAQEGGQGIEELCRALADAKVTVALPVVISPQLAQVLADLQSERQRRQNPRHIQALERDVSESRWPLTGDTLKVDSEGVLRDGGHRTAAVLRAGKPITSYMAFGITPESSADVDAGKPRTPGEVLYMNGTDNATGTAAVALRVWCWDKGYHVTHGRPKMSKEELVGYVQSHPWLEDFVKLYRSRLPRGFAGSIVSTAAVLFDRVDPEAGEEFLNALCTGANLPEGSPILYLRNRVPRGWNTSPGSKRRQGVAPAFKHDQVLALTIAAWNRWREGKPVSRSGLYLPSPLTNKNFPRPH